MLFCTFLSRVYIHTYIHTSTRIQGALMEKNPKAKTFLLRDSFLPLFGSGHTKAFNEGQKGYWLVAQDIQDYELCIKQQEGILFVYASI